MLCCCTLNRSNLEALSKPCQDLEQLAEADGLHKRLVEEKGKTAARFDPLRDKYRVLEKFEVQVPDAQLELLDRLDAEWARFQVGRLAAIVCKLQAQFVVPGSVLASCVV
jgi:dynein heavy chain